MFIQSKPLVIDGKGHITGRLAAMVAKALLNGQRVVVVRCEELTLTGSLYRKKLDYRSFLRKRINTNPRRGPFHYRHPHKMFWRSVRGMLPHKLHRGRIALAKLKTYEGIPPPYDKTKRVVVPSCLRAVRSNPRRKNCKLGQLAHEVGWKYKGVIQTLEAKRMVKAKEYHLKKKADAKLMDQAKKNLAKKIAPYQKIIESLGGN